MSFEEKRTWIYAVVTILVCGGYLRTVFGEIQTVPVAEIDYVADMIVTVIIAVILEVAGIIVVASVWPKDADRRDERDIYVNRLGEHVGGIFFGVVVLVPLGLAMLELEHFWIAHAIFAAYVLAALTRSAVKIVAYRWGL